MNLTSSYVCILIGNSRAWGQKEDAVADGLSKAEILCQSGDVGLAPAGQR